MNQSERDKKIEAIIKSIEAKYDRLEQIDQELAEIQRKKNEIIFSSID